MQNNIVPIISACIVSFVGCIAYFYKNWSTKVRDYSNSLFELQYILECNLSYLNCYGECDDADKEIQEKLCLLPMFNSTDMDVIDDVVRLSILDTNKSLIPMKLNLTTFDASMIVENHQHALDVIDVCLGLAKKSLSNPVKYYVITQILFFLKKNDHSYNPRHSKHNEK